jgi:hypothetical protein
MKVISFSHKNSVILSEGEPRNLLFSQDLLEPQSKDLARISMEVKQRKITPLHMERLSRIAPTAWTNLPFHEKVLPSPQTSLLVGARSFDFGSGSSLGGTISFDSPPLRMTEVFSPVVAQGGTR